MEQRHAQETYLGHKLEATAYEQRKGWWSWDYLIDGKTHGGSTANSLLQDPEAALRRALMAARARADVLI